MNVSTSDAMSVDVIGIGSLNYDYLHRAESLAQSDSQQVILETVTSAGGSAANTIYGLAKLGVTTGFLGAVGADAEGTEILTQMRELGIDTSKIEPIKNEATSKVLVFVDNSGERAMYSLPGASLAFQINKNDIDWLTESKYVIISALPDKLQFNRIREIVDAIHENTHVVFMPGALYTNYGFEKLEDIIAKAYLLLLNRREITLLTGQEPQQGSEWLVEHGCQMVGVTLGADGCMVCNKDNNSGNTFTIPTPKVQKNDIVDSTGAGDAFAAGFIFGLIENRAIKEAGLIGNLAAGACILGLGARTSLLDKRTLMLEFDKNIG